MDGRNAGPALRMMTDHDDELIMIVTERFERRLSEENGELRVEMVTEFGKVRAEMTSEFGKVRTEMATEFGKVRAEMTTEFGSVRTEMASEFGRVRTEMAAGFGQLRADMIDRNVALLRWLLVFGALQTTALAAVIALVT